MYQALYRKWRPMSFDDVVSQPHITTTLRNQIQSGKTAHAYLFTGSRGTGKTTCARIFAKAVNCPNSVDGEPCLECEICKSADAGTLSDMIEIDAASNSKVDDIRELREGVNYTPELCRYKVYIIDEVHMLSAGAFNALLKTMEEPPEHVKFILATTEVHKVPETIVSRCQHFDFHRIRTEDIVSRLSYIAEQEKLTLHEDAAQLIARLSDGGMRDALSLLDQCVAYSEDITIRTVSDAAGIAGRDYLFDILSAVLKQDAPAAIQKIDDLYGMSKDLAVLCSELISQLRNIMILKSGKGARELIVCLPEELERLEEMAAGVELEAVFAYIGILQQCSERFARARNKCIEMEMCAVRLCSWRPGTPADSQQSAAAAPAAQTVNLAPIFDRLSKLEKALSSGQAFKAPVQTEEPPKKQERKPLVKFDPRSMTPLNEWNEILAIINEQIPSIGAFLKNSSACIEGDMFYVIAAGEFVKKLVERGDDAAKLKQIISNYYGKNFGFRLYPAKDVGIEEKKDPLSELANRAKAAELEVEIKK